MNLYIVVIENGAAQQTYAVHCESQYEARKRVLGRNTGWHVTGVYFKEEPALLKIHHDDPRDAAGESKE